MGNKEFNFQVGDVVTKAIWSDVLTPQETITAIGQDYFLATTVSGAETCRAKNDDWLPYTPPRKTVRMAACVYESGGTIVVSQSLFRSIKEVNDHFHAKIVQFPLTINNVEQWVDVPLEE